MTFQTWQILDRGKQAFFNPITELCHTEARHINCTRLDDNPTVILTHLALVGSHCGCGQRFGIFCGCLLKHLLILSDQIIGSPSVRLPGLCDFGQAPRLVPKPGKSKKIQIYVIVGHIIFNGKDETSYLYVFWTSCHKTHLPPVRLKTTSAILVTNTMRDQLLCMSMRNVIDWNAE